MIARLWCSVSSRYGAVWSSGDPATVVVVAPAAGVVSVTVDAVAVDVGKLPSPAVGPSGTASTAGEHAANRTAAAANGSPFREVTFRTRIIVPEGINRNARLYPNIDTLLGT